MRATGSARLIEARVGAMKPLALVVRCSASETVGLVSLLASESESATLVTDPSWFTTCREILFGGKRRRNSALGLGAWAPGPEEVSLKSENDPCDGARVIAR